MVTRSLNNNRSRVFDFRSEKPDTSHAGYRLMRPVFFVGFMGAGKTSVVRKLAHDLGLSSLDMDVYISRATHMKTARMFEEVGEEVFRETETELLRELIEGSAQLISCGGGVIQNSESRALLKDKSFVVYLKVTVEEARLRITDISKRPLFKNSAQAAQLIEERLPLYEEVANVIIDTAGHSSRYVADELCDILKQEGILVKSE